MNVTVTVLETSNFPVGKMRVIQDVYKDSHVKFVTCEMTFSKAERKKNPQLPLFISITDGHASVAKAAMTKHLENLLGKT